MIHFQLSLAIQEARRNWLAAVVLATSLAAPAAAQAPADYPSKPVRIIVPAAPGSASESIGRTLGEFFSRKLGQPFVVEPVPGAAGIIGTVRVTRAPADGYTLLMGFNQLVTMNPHLYDKLPYEPQRDLVPVGLIQRGGFLLLVNKDLPVDDVPGLIAMATRSPGKLTYASTGNGSAPHLGMELFKKLTGTDLLHVPYKGGSTALTDLIAGQVQVKIEPKISGLAALKSGKVKIIGVTSRGRFPSLPEVPAVAETVPGFEVAGWNAIWAPAGTPPAVMGRLQQTLAEALTTPQIRDKLVAMGIDPEPAPSDAVIELTRRESAQWASLIRQAGIRAD